MIPQFFLKRFSSNKPLILRINVLWGNSVYPPPSFLLLKWESSNILIVAHFSLFSLHLVPCTYCRPSGKPSELQGCKHTFEVKKEKKVQQIKREGSIKGEGGLYKKLKIPTLPPKLPRSGVTFHYFPGDFCKSWCLQRFWERSRTWRFNACPWLWLRLGSQRQIWSGPQKILGKGNS